MTPASARTTAWDRHPAAELARLRDRLVSEQLRREVAFGSPYWIERMAELDIEPVLLDDAASLTRLPTSAEYELCPGGDAAGAARLVLQPGADSPAATAARARLRRFLDRDGYRQALASDLRPTSYVFEGLAVRFPVASTRADLDVVARAGARLWQVAGLGPADVLVSAAPVAASALHQALSLGALAAGTPALFPGPAVADVAATLRLVPATVLAVPSEAAGDLLYDLAAAGAGLAGLRTVLLLGAPDDAERAVVRDALADVGAAGAVAVGVHVASAHRLAWAECRESAARGTPAGLHTYPDLEVVEAVDPETGGPASGAGPAELAVTQLGMRGSALVRWRTGDLVAPDGIADGPCPACGRLVPRVPVLRRRALVVPLERADAPGGAPRPVDLRALGAALGADADVRDYRVAVEGGRVSVGYAAGKSADPDELALDLGERLLAACGVAPARLVPMAPGAPPARWSGAPGQLTPRMVVRGGAGGLG